MDAHISDVVRQLKRPRVLVAGDLLLDEYVFGAVSRISPEAPIPVVHVRSDEYRLGGAANVARNLAALGARVSCAGVVGKDANGALLKKLLRTEQIQTPQVITDAKKPTGTKTRVVAHHQQMLRVDKEDAAQLRRSTERALTAAVRNAAQKAELIVLSDYQKGTLTPAVCRAALGAEVPVVVGLKGGEIAKFCGATGASLNQAELFSLTKEKTLELAARQLVREMKLKFLIVTLGERGMAIFGCDDKTIELPTVAQDVYDVTGAGDTVLAAFALAYASGASLLECARVANTAAGIVVGKIGTAVATRQEVIRHMSGEESLHAHKALKEQELLRTVKKERERGKTIVFTNGCFDILHAGHAKLLQFAKRQGDILIVGLNSDDSIRRIKGKSRPIIAEDERAHVLAALQAVDFITTFDSDTPLALIKKIRPDVLVKGEDWKGKSVVGREYARRVVLAPLLEGRSTTNIVERIVERHKK